MHKKSAKVVFNDFVKCSTLIAPSFSRSRSVFLRTRVRQLIDVCRCRSAQESLYFFLSACACV